MTYTEAVQKAFHPKNGWNYIKGNNEVGWFDEDGVRYFVPMGSDGQGFEKRPFKLFGKILFHYWWFTKDWSSNFNFPKKKYNKYRTHRGIDKDYKTIQDDIMKLCLEAHDRGLTVIFIGFSRGGGMAYRMIENYFYLTGIIPEAYLFGTPRVWGFKNWRLLKTIYSRTKVYLVKTCLVSHLPPIIFGFRHYGEVTKLKPHYLPWEILNNHMSYREY